MAVKITYFVHGTTYDNLDHRSTGWLPGELSPKGIEQAKALKEKVKMEEIDLVFCSDLKRAIDSAEIVFGNEKTIYQDKRLRECNYGLYDGKDTSLVVYENHIEERFPEGESMLDVEERIKSFGDYLLEKFDGKHIAIVAHKAPQLAIQVLTQGKDWKQAIAEDWRKTKAWQPGWSYVIDWNNK